jgi:hypothetical protein
VLRRLVWFVLALPAAIILIALALSNRHAVRLVLDPFRPADPVLSLVLPFYVYLFAVLILGILIGGTLTWLTQAGWRRTARSRSLEVRRWQAEADRLQRERETQLAGSQRLVPINR